MNAQLHAINQGPLSAGLRLLPSRFDTPRARAQLLKIGLQESLLVHRDQLERNGKNIVLGPALGLWQFERGGIAALARHPATRALVTDLRRQCGVPDGTTAIWQRLATDDAFAAAIARLNLYWHPDPLPQLDDAQGSFDYYLFCWRPGAYRSNPEAVRAKWMRNHATVVDYLRVPA